MCFAVVINVGLIRRGHSRMPNFFCKVFKKGFIKLKKMGGCFGKLKSKQTFSCLKILNWKKHGVLPTKQRPVLFMLELSEKNNKLPTLFLRLKKKTIEK